MKKIIIPFVLILLFSCNQEEKQKVEIQEKRTSKIEEIKSQYGIKYSMTDLNRFDYSYQFNPVIQSGKQLMKYYTIHDIYTKNNKNYVAIETYKFYFDLLVENEKILNELKNNEDEYHRVENKILVLELKNIRKMPFVIDITENGEDTYMEVIGGDRFIGKGKVLELIKI
ncbi:hypothetical protein ULMA_02330 [Patiriisocius marinus]|uniref:Uncharacterized protein n=1 Tax=Patiriisocius marinus TaxID=1397112 RepID=A0A5J4IM12_9FLAO|nr:hypothetical protein [Patiriisocius marinus]GER58125.1 hypothetical protein ULMA_02330 [Patiriisocius marinus]